MTIHDSGRIGNGFAWDKMGERAKWHRVLTVGAGLAKWGNGEFEKDEMAPLRLVCIRRGERHSLMLSGRVCMGRNGKRTKRERTNGNATVHLNSGCSSSSCHSLWLWYCIHGTVTMVVVL